MTGDDLEHRLRQISGIGPKLARRILRNLGINDIETLRMAVESGRIEGSRRRGSGDGAAAM